MIILGDVASPNSLTSEVIVNAILQADFNKSQSILFNLEGLITDTYSTKIDKPILYNHSSVLESFKKFDTKIAALANNHTLDLPEFLDSTKELLTQKNYKTLGAGDQKDENFEYVIIQESGYNVYVLNACWDFLLHHQNTNNHSKTIHIIDEEKILNWVKEVKVRDKNAKIVLYFHWSFDLETLPFPSYRRFSKALIDAGTSLVVGAHSHCIQGGEEYNGGYIVYGLGNFFIPNNIYANGKLIFPKMSNKGLVIEWDIINNRLVNHWFDYSFENSNHTLGYLGSENFKNSKVLNNYAAFSTMSDTEYDLYFKKNRRKKILVPIFYQYEPSITNKLKMKALKTRSKIARFLAEKGLIGWQN